MIRFEINKKNFFFSSFQALVAWMSTNSELAPVAARILGSRGRNALEEAISTREREEMEARLRAVRKEARAKARRHQKGGAFGSSRAMVA